jgi:hypothetical protein
MRNIRLIIFILCLSLVSLEGEEYRDRIISDLMLVVPGVGAEKAILGSDLNGFLKRTRRAQYKVSRPVKPGEVFADILKINTDIKLFFDEIYLNEETGSVIYSFGKTITAVGGFSADRQTVDMVDLKAGMENFLFNYGNRGLEKIENNISRVYIYKSSGIAVFDDGKNDTIDLYLVFPVIRNR